MDKVSIHRFILRFPFLIFACLTISLGWLPWYVRGEPQYLFIVPFFTGLVMAVLTDGKNGLKTYLKRMLRWRAPWYIWFSAIFIPAVVTLMAVGLFMLLGGELPKSALLTVNATNLDQLFMLGVVFLLPLGSDNIGEIGFRGFGLPALQEKWGPLAGTLVLGVFVSLWFLPQFFDPTSPQYAMGGLRFLPFFFLIEIGWAVPMTWVYNRSGGSSLIAGYIFHSAFNYWTVVLLVNAAVVDGKFVFDNFNGTLFRIYAVLVVLTAIIFILVTKGKLGYATTNK